MLKRLLYLSGTYIEAVINCKRQILLKSIIEKLNFETVVLKLKIRIVFS